MQTLWRRVRARLARLGGSPRSRRGPLAHRQLTRRRLAAVLCAVAAAWVAFAVYNETAQSHAADQRLQQLQQQNDALRQDIAQRQRQIAEAQSDTWLADEARRMGYVRSGERVYVPVAPGQPLPADGGIDTGPLPSFAPATPTGSPAPSPALPGASPAPPTPVVVPGR
ncbi:MAG TPA: septum formation initiator family protein [Candidatus Dormibacteraeota bacterium]